MHEATWSELLISHAEREQAFNALAAHVQAGRLTTDEYGDRAESLNVARTRGQVGSLFTDLPAPGPRFEVSEPPDHPRPPTELAVPADTDATVSQDSQPPTVRQGLARASVPVGAVTAVGLTYVTGNWMFMFVTPPVTFAVESALRGRRWRRR